MDDTNMSLKLQTPKKPNIRCLNKHIETIKHRPIKRFMVSGDLFALSYLLCTVQREPIIHKFEIQHYRYEGEKHNTFQVQETHDPT